MVVEKAWAVFVARVSSGLKKGKHTPSYDWIAADNKVDIGLLTVVDVCVAIGGWKAESPGQGVVGKDEVSALYEHAKAGQPAALGTYPKPNAPLAAKMDDLKLYASHQYGGKWTSALPFTWVIVGEYVSF